MTEAQNKRAGWNLIWVHEDALRDDHPAYIAAPYDTRRVFVWDKDDFQARGYSLKRLVFLHECLQDMTVDVIAGHTKEVLSALNPDRLYTAQTHDPARRAIISALRETCDVIQTPDAVLTEVSDDTELGRFFRFWNKARRSAMSFSSEDKAVP